MADIPQYRTRGARVPGPQSIAGAERVVYHVIKTGLDLLAASVAKKRGKRDDAIDRLFALYNAEERDTIRRLLAERRPKVSHGYPRSNAEMPAILVIVTSENENRRFVGDKVENDEEDMPEFIGRDPETVKGVLVDTSIDCWVMDNNPDVVQAFYTICWALLDGARLPVFSRLQMNPGSLSGGDVPPDPNYMPEYVFVRRLGTSFTGMRTVAFEDEIWDGIMVQISASV